MVDVTQRIFGRPSARAPAVDRVRPLARDAGEVDGLVANLGFLLHRDLPHRGRDAMLIVAMRERATERHFDPELLVYWRTDAMARGRQAELTPVSRPMDGTFSWGAIELVDRFGVTNTFVGVGGQVIAHRPDSKTIIATFTSPGPILRRGGHSQGYDQLAAELSGFFARVLVRIDFEPGAERLVAMASPLVRYAAFLRHDSVRLRASDLVRDLYGRDAHVVLAEAERLRLEEPAAWSAGVRLLTQLRLTGGEAR